jgi:hypothetical protein
MNIEHWDTRGYGGINQGSGHLLPFTPRLCQSLRVPTDATINLQQNARINNLRAFADLNTNLSPPLPVAANELCDSNFEIRR